MAVRERPESGVKSVQMAFDVLEALAAAPDDVGVSELAIQLGTTKGTIFRHLQTLAERGYVEQKASARYKLGMRAYLIGRVAGERIELLEASGEAMAALREEIGETVVVSALRGRALHVLRQMFGTSEVEIGVRKGSELTLHRTAQGKIVLAFGKPTLFDQVVRQGLTALTEYTIVDPEKLRIECAHAREKGYTTAPNEQLLGINAIAAPILDRSGELVGTIAIVGSIQNVAPEPDMRQVAAVRRAALKISWNLGYEGMMPGQPIETDRSAG